MTNQLTNIKKVRIALRNFLIGKGFHMASRAFNYAEKLHTGTRKDGVTPSFHHQISIANYLMTLPLDDKAMETVAALAFLHDTPEDKAVSAVELAVKFGDEVATGSMALAKKFRGVELSKEVYFYGLSNMALPALVKGVDRLNNLSTMVGVFTLEKQQKYIDETIEWHLPMLKKARREFPEYNAAFENVKYSLLSRLEMSQLYLDTIKNITNAEIS